LNKRQNYTGGASGGDPGVGRAVTHLCLLRPDAAQQATGLLLGEPRQWWMIKNSCGRTAQATIPHLTRSSLHRCLQRHGISRLPQDEGNGPDKRKFKTYPIG